MAHEEAEDRRAGINNGLTWERGNELVQTLGSQESLVDNIASLLTLRGWSQSELARRMAEQGCPLGQPAVSRILGKERRQVAIDELIAFSRVFEVPVGELLLPPRASQHAQVMAAVAKGAQLQQRVWELRRRQDQLALEVARMAMADEAVAAYVDAILKRDVPPVDGPRRQTDGQSEFLELVRARVNQLRSAQERGASAAPRRAQERAEPSTPAAARSARPRLPRDRSGGLGWPSQPPFR